MQVFLPNRHRLHAPRWYVADGSVHTCPDHPDRVDHIREALERGGHAIVPCESKMADSGASRSASANAVDPWPAIRVVHSGEYLDYLQTIHALWTAEFGAGVDVLPDTFPRLGRAPGRPSKPAAQAGYYSFDMAAPITAGTWTAALDSASCAVRAADAVARGARASYALCRPPGHHAGRDYCGGFCYLNNAALAAQHLILLGKKRIAILDLDYHHGNGTQDIFYSRSDVLFVSIHADPNTQYPYFWGYADQTGEGHGAGFTHNFPLPRGTGERLWLDALSRAIESVRAFDPEVLVVSLGVDAYEKDTVGDFGTTQEGFAAAGRVLRRLDVPTVLIQEGGYNLDAVGPCVAAVLQPFA